MGILSWLIIGGLAGFIAGKIMQGYGNGLIMNIIIGIVGAFIGGFIMNTIGGIGITGFSLWSLIVAIIGSVVLLAIINALRGRA